MKVKVIAYLILLLCLLQGTFSMVTKKKFKFSGNKKFQFLARFAIGAGKAGNFNVKAKLVKPYKNKGDNYKVDVVFYEDDRWETALALSDCTSKRQVKNFKSDIMLTGDGEWSQTYNQFALAKGETKVWYIGVADCEGLTHAHYPAMPKIEVEIEMLNGGDHFSEDEWGNFTWNILSFVIMLLLFGNTVLEFLKDFKREHTYEHPLLFLTVGICADLLCVFLEIVHLSKYIYDGRGFFVLTVFSRLSYMLAQVAIIWMLLMIAYGWTIHFQSVDEKDIYVILMLFVAMIHLMITALTYVDDDEHHKYHDFAGVQGLIIVILRLILFAAYCFGAKSTYESASGKKKQAFRSF